jgi:hypothetical protein
MASSYLLDEFMEQYDLPRSEAERIFRITGPLKADVDALMAVKSRRADASDWVLDPYSEVPRPRNRPRRAAV